MDMEWLRDNCYSDESIYNMIKASEMTFHDPAEVGLPTVQYDEIDTDEGKFKYVGILSQNVIYTYHRCK